MRSLQNLFEPMSALFTIVKHKNCHRRRNSLSVFWFYTQRGIRFQQLGFQIHCALGQGKSHSLVSYSVRNEDFIGPVPILNLSFILC